MLPMTYQYHTFPNGIRLVHKQSKSFVSHLGVIVHAGSRDETPQQQGMAHFIEHLIFKGTKNRSNIQVLSRLENVGADLNAFTTKEDTNVYASVLSKHYSRTAELLADILFNSTFPDKEIVKEKAVVIDEINSYKDNPADWIHDEFDEMVFKNHPLGMNILGTKEKLKKFTREDILKFRDANYCTSGIVISSISSLSLARAVDIIGRYFADIPASERQNARIGFQGYSPEKVEKKYSRHQAHAVIGCPAYDAYNPQRICLALVNNMLGGPAMNSRLNIQLREKNGIAYNLESNYQSFSDTGLFSVYCGTENALLEKAISLINKEMNRFREARLSTNQLHIAKQQLKGQLCISLEAQQNEMLSMGKNLLLYHRVDTIEDIFAKIDSVTADQILETANQIFDPRQMSMLIFKNS